MEIYFNTNISKIALANEILLNFTGLPNSYRKDSLLAETDCLIRTKENFTAVEEPTCNASWDGFLCWPATPINQLALKPCSDLVRQSGLFNSTAIQGNAFRYCTNEASWVEDGYSNYSECVKELMGILKKSDGFSFQATQSYVLFIGCLISIICLCSFIIIYGCFRSTYIVRVQILLHINIALLARCFLWIVVVGPTIFPGLMDYRTVNWACNVVFSTHFYTLLVPAFWMVILGHYLHNKLQKIHSLRRKFPWIFSILFSWAVPLIVVSTWALLMLTFEDSTCWVQYTKSKLFWIISIPLVAAFIVNFLYLINIVRLFVKRISLIRSHTQQKQIRSAQRDIIILFPVLGINHLLFLYNPGGDFGNYYMFVHAIFQSVQGILVPVLCCFLSSDVRRSLWQGIQRSCRFRCICCAGTHPSSYDDSRTESIQLGRRKKRVSFADRPRK